MERRALVVLILAISLAGCSTIPLKTEASSESLGQVQNTSDLYQQPEDMEFIVKKAMSASFQISCGQNSGSGWGLSIPNTQNDARFIVTNHHVIADCLNGGELLVWNDWGMEIQVEVFASAYQDYSLTDNLYAQDLALLKVVESQFVVTPEMTSNHPIGSWVLISGFPGLSQGVPSVAITTGIISSNTGLEGLTTTAAINPGSSGSMVMNSRGQIIGTVYAGFDENVLNDNGIFLPISRVWDLWASRSIH